MNDKMNFPEEYKGFRLIKESYVEDNKAVARHFVHSTGLEVFHLSCSDEENLFAFAFRTPNKSSVGAAHIMEHSVLCGSEKYPLKEPFTNLMNTSAATFLNAYTCFDKTVYPASSLIKADFFNLFRVYADAVFSPILSKDTFLQEAHRTEVDEKGKFSIQGVVYNEMKGNYSSFESVAADEQLKSLFPKTCYSFDSGGDPLVIPSFTYEDFLAFYKKYYRSDNAILFLYGNIPTKEHLDFLNAEVLPSIRPPSSGIDIAVLKKEIIEMESPPLEKKEIHINAKAPETASSGSTVTLNYLLSLSSNIEAFMEASFLASLLLGTDGSPLSRALLSSSLGDSLAPYSGVMRESRNMIFSIGLHGVKEEDKEKVFSLIERELKEIAEKGVTKDELEAALNSAEFDLAEVIRRGSPYSLELLERVLAVWNYGDEEDLASSLRYRAAFKKIREKTREASYIKNLVRRLLIDNPHKSFVTVSPSAAYLKNRQAKEEEIIGEKAAKYTNEALKTLKKELNSLHEKQNRKESEEETACLPRLKAAELPENPLWHGVNVSKIGKKGFPLLSTSESTGDVVYASLAFPLEELAAKYGAKYYEYLPLFASVAIDAGFGGEKWDKCAIERAKKCGDINVELLSASPVKEGNIFQGRDYVVFSVKFLKNAADDALSLFFSAVSSFDFSDKERLESLILEAKSDFLSSVLPKGHQFAKTRALMRANHSAALEEIWGGFHQVFALSSFVDEKNMDACVENLALRFSQIKEALLSSSALVRLCSEAEDFEEMKEKLASHLDKSNFVPLKEKQNVEEEDFISLLDEADKKREIFTSEMQVGYSAASLYASAFSTPEYAAEAVLAHQLTGTYLWEKIRTTGGAYGAGASCNGNMERFTFYTYRDPAPLVNKTEFTAALKNASQSCLSENEVENRIVGVFSKFISPHSPKGYDDLAFRRFISGISEKEWRANLLNIRKVCADDVQKAASRLLKADGERKEVILMNYKGTEDCIRKLPI